jgi:Putative Actinobacterial Holin-X, holin superfamily III
MDDQAMINLNVGLDAAEGNGRKAAPNGDDTRTRSDLRSGGDMVMRGVAGFGESLLSLAELQARLAEVELRQNLQAARAGIFLALSSGVAAWSGLIIMLAGLAELMVSEMGVKRGIALLSVATVTIAAGAACLALAAARLRAKRLGFPLSYEELARNLNWLRTVLRQSGRARR